MTAFEKLHASFKFRIGFWIYKTAEKKKKQSRWKKNQPRNTARSCSFYLAKKADHKDDLMVAISRTWYKLGWYQSRTQSLQAFWSAGQRREDSGDIEFYYRRISAVKQWKPFRNSQSKKLNFFDVPRVFPALPRWPKSLKTLGTRLGWYPMHGRWANQNSGLASSNEWPSF